MGAVARSTPSGSAALPPALCTMMPQYRLYGSSAEVAQASSSRSAPRALLHVPQGAAQSWLTKRPRTRRSQILLAGQPSAASRGGGRPFARSCVLVARR